MTTMLTGIVCGNCTKEQGTTVRHSTTAEVRACYARKYAPRVGEEIMTDAEETRLIQARERAEDERVAAYKAARDEALAAPKSSAGAGDPKGTFRVDPWVEIRRLQALLPDVPKMHYAIEVTDFTVSPAPVWKFYRVDKPQKGRWAGRTFVNVQASDDYHPVKSPETLKAVLGAITHNPEKAAGNYGHQIGRCGVCSRTLTDPESIARGIGPVCAGRLGW